MEKLKKILESTAFKYVSYVFWVVYFGAIVILIDTFAHVAICWSCNSISYRVFYKIGLFLNMGKYEIFNYFDFVLLRIAPFVVIFGFLVLVSGTLTRKFFLKKKIPWHWLIWLIIITLPSLYFMFYMINHIFFNKLK